MRVSALLALLSLAPPASPSEPAPPTIVLMVPEQAGELDEHILATVSAHLRELDVELVVERHAASLDLRTLIAASREPTERADARGILWIDVPSKPGGDLGLYVVEREGQQIYGRTIAGTVGDAVAIETLANVAAMAATALSEGRAIQLDVPTPRESEPIGEPEPEPIVEPEPPPTGTITREGHVELVRRPWLRLRAGYRGNNFADTIPWQSSVTFAIGVRPAPRAHVELVADVAIPSTLALADLRIVLQRYPFALAGGYQWPLRRGWDVELSGRLGLEPTLRKSVSTSTDGSPTARPSSLRWFASAELGVAAGVRLTDTVRLSFGVGLAAVLARRDYVIGLSQGSSTSERVVISPHPVRGLVWAGFDFDLVWR
ncbi:hypothetical protein ACNOYE_25930 [Nannocystaceae bacterium ST9]